MSVWTQDSVSEALGVTAQEKWVADRVVIDSRAVQTGDIFIALKGENFDGNQFIAKAFEQGVVAAVASDGAALGDKPGVVVVDTLEALQALARYRRAHYTKPLVGITGSVGKTSTREMVRLALSAHGMVHTAEKNYNNHIGLPLTIANIPADTDFTVAEMGMNHAGEIAALTNIAQPDCAIITNVEAVHLEFFESTQGIADAKSELFEGMNAGGVVILNCDNEWFDYVATKAQANQLKIISLGWDAAADIRIASYNTSNNKSAITLVMDGKEYNITLHTLGKHWGYAVANALAVAHSYQLDIVQSIAAIETYQEVAGRGGITKLNDDMLLIDDSYNASPASMIAAFAKLHDVDTPGRKIAVLGDMLELGDQEAQMHAALASDIAAAQITQVITCGTLMKHLHNALPEDIRAAHVSDIKDLPDVVAAHIQSGDALLVKGSHGSGVHSVIQPLKERFSAL